MKDNLLSCFEMTLVILCALYGAIYSATLGLLVMNEKWKLIKIKSEESDDLHNQEQN